MSDDVNVEATREIASRGGNIFVPDYAASANDKGFPVYDVDEQEALTAAFGGCSSMWSQTTADEAVGDVFRAFVRLLPKLDLVSVYHEPATADFHWAPLRCILAGAGHAWHHELTSMLIALYPQCPMDPQETAEDWLKSVREAHRLSGWPVTFTLAQWRDIAFAVKPMDDDTPTPKWLRIFALFHVLKHLRFSSSLGLVVTFLGTLGAFQPDHRTSLIGASNSLRQQLTQALGGRLKPPKNQKYPATAALDHALRTLNCGDLLQRKARTELPGCVLAGPWSYVTPDPVNTHGFIQHGARLDGVWLARDGRITSVPGETHDIVTYDWALHPAHENERRVFAAALPATYQHAHGPAFVLFGAFPNVNFAPYGGDPLACAALLDAVLCAALLRNDDPRLDREKPLILCVPTQPDFATSTNTGKTAAAATLARAMCPGIKAIKAGASDSAPDQRALAATIEQFGSLCLDEFVEPKSRGHILSRDNLQSMVTGGEVVVGKAYENAPRAVAPKQPLVFSVKTWDAPDDIMNRALVVALDQLTEDQRARGDVWADVDSGTVGLQVRLAAVAMVETFGLLDKLAKLKPGSTVKGWRFNMLRALAVLILCRRTGWAADRAEAVLDEACARMRTWFAEHVREAETSGLLAAQEEGTSVKVRLPTLMDGLTCRDMEMVKAGGESHASSTHDGHGVSPQGLLKAVAAAMGLGDNCALSRLLERMTGSRARVSDRSMALALSRDIRAMMPNVGDVWILPGTLGLAGWRIIRNEDNNGSPRVAIVLQAPEPLKL